MSKKLEEVVLRLLKAIDENGTRLLVDTLEFKVDAIVMQKETIPEDDEGEEVEVEYSGIKDILEELGGLVGVDNQEPNAYLFVDTWNGSGYSDSKAELIFIGNTDLYLKKAFDDMGGFDNFKINEQGNPLRISYSDEEEEDSGAVELISFDTDTVGVIVIPNYNEHIVVTSQVEWDNLIEHVKLVSEEVKEEGEDVLGTCHHGIGDDGVDWILFSRDMLKD